MKVKATIKVWGSLVLAQIQYTDKRFRKKNPANPPIKFFASNGFGVGSDICPGLFAEGICLHGTGRTFDRVKLWRDCESEKEAIEYASSIKQALQEWASDWEGFKEPSIN